MRALAENSSRDLFKGANGQLGVVSDLDALVQVSKSAIEAQRGEMQFSRNRGIPTEQTLWSGTPNQQQFQFYCRQALLAIDGVTAVAVFTTEIIDNTLNYQATILTIYGEGLLSGSL